MNTRKEINFFGNTGETKNNDMIKIEQESSAYFGKFDLKSGRYILTGGASPNMAKIMDISNKTYVTFTGFEKELYCGEWSNNNQYVALSGDDGCIRIYQNNF